MKNKLEIENMVYGTPIFDDSAFRALLEYERFCQYKESVHEKHVDGRSTWSPTAKLMKSYADEHGTTVLKMKMECNRVEKYMKDNNI